MSAAARYPSNAAVIDELITDATVEALNAALAGHGISADRIVAVHYLDGVYLANGAKPRYRVLYRA
ncbi:hypothetical protein [Labrys wisconsinensis]|uniref:Uncharacterized protein n=1 Tax=Labrys wisconsinensis TaxID=425677 RepID=A0ABU0J801_9HYPH|nr:hypothetical protein [Labrys wisconsinensis]MDQ0470390.1 hypothetical protein [Labrys wisconsinensis]